MKLYRAYMDWGVALSRPAWARELKLAAKADIEAEAAVAPRVGA